MSAAFIVRTRRQHSSPAARAFRALIELLLQSSTASEHEHRYQHETKDKMAERRVVLAGAGSAKAAAHVASEHTIKQHRPYVHGARPSHFSLRRKTEMSSR